jgi:predicted cupin superfamily sugar epimerase
MSLSPDQVIEMLGLKAHPTCGFALETYRSDLQIPAGALPPEYGGSRTLGGVLYFLVTPQAPVRLHRIRSDQMYHYYLGDPLEVLLLYPGGGSEVRVVGPDLAAGMRP